MKTIMKTFVFCLLLVSVTTAASSFSTPKIAEKKQFFSIYSYGYFNSGGNTYEVFVDSSTGSITSIVSLTGSAVVSFTGYPYVNHFGLIAVNVSVTLANSSTFSYNNVVYQ